MYLKAKYEFLALNTYLWSVSNKSDAKIHICCSKIKDRRYMCLPMIFCKAQNE